MKFDFSRCSLKELHGMLEGRCQFEEDHHNMIYPKPEQMYELEIIKLAITLKSQHIYIMDGQDLVGFDRFNDLIKRSEKYFGNNDLTDILVRLRKFIIRTAA